MKKENNIAILGGASREQAEKMERMRALRLSTGMNRRAFCEKYHIPYQTVTEWELGRREMPDYVLELLEYRVKMEEILKDLDLEL